MKRLWLSKQNYCVYPDETEKGPKDYVFYVYRYTKHDYLRLIDVIVKHCQKETVKSSLLLARMLASYTLKGCTGMHFRVFWSRRRLLQGKVWERMLSRRKKVCKAKPSAISQAAQSHLPFHKLHRYHHFEVIRISVFQLQHMD